MKRAYWKWTRTGRAGILARQAREEQHAGEQSIDCENPECSNSIEPGQTMVIWFRARKRKGDEIIYGKFCSRDCKNNGEHLDLEAGEDLEDEAGT